MSPLMVNAGVEVWRAPSGPFLSQYTQLPGGASPLRTIITDDSNRVQLRLASRTREINMNHAVH